MVNILSPKIHWIEKDLSEFAPAINSSIVGIVGFASKGPTNEATLITSPQRLRDLFGPAQEAITGQGLEGAVEILEATNQIYFVRASDEDTEANASGIVQYGSCPHIQISAVDYGVTQNLFLKVQVTRNNGTSAFTTVKTYNIPSGTVATGGGQAQALLKVIGGDLDSAKIGIHFTSATSSTGYLVGTFAGSGASISVSAYTNASLIHSSHTSALILLGPSGTASGGGTNFSSIQIYGTSLETGIDGVQYTSQSLYPGAGYNAGTKSNGDTSGNSVEIDSLGGANVSLQVNQDGTAQETFKVSLIENAGFIEDEINVGIDNPTSDIIKGELYADGIAITPAKMVAFEDKLNVTFTDMGATFDAQGTAGQADWNTSGTGGAGVGIRGAQNPRFIKPLESTYNLIDGDNGIPVSDTDQATAIIGDSTVTPKTGMQALDDAQLNISVAIVPGITNQDVQNNLITLAESTQEFIAVVSPPFAIGTVQNANDWHNGQTDTRTAAINSTRAAIFWPWVKTFLVNDEKSIWLDPGIYGVRQMMHTDNVAEPWFAAAGSNRGRLTKPNEIEVKTNQGDRDSLYTGGNTINPIVAFPQRGIMIFGNKTTSRKPSALQSLSIVRLLIHLRKVVVAATRDFLFEPNDEFTWERIENIVNPILDDIARRRGIVTVDGTPQYKVICDETTNTGVRVDRNELWCKIIFKPTKTAENIVFEVNLTSQTAEIGS